MKRSARRILGPAIIPAISLLTGSCATNPATGGRMFSLVSEGQEIQMGQQYSQQVEAEMSVLDDASLQAYVDRVGQEMASLSERPELPWSFKVVDDPVVNAFALPGGPIYLTRGIMTHFSSEAEMAAVLGHEIGHITARHSVEQISRQQLAGGLLIAGAIASPVVRQNIGALSAGMQVLFLSYGRGDEHQSDMLGVRYSSRADYDIREAPTMHEKLGRITAGAGGRGVPDWLSTHPSSEDRIERLEAQVDTFPPAYFETARLGGDEFLRAIDGIVFGEDPRQGYFQADNRFVHPDLVFVLDYPDGWRVANQPSAVLALSPDEDALIELRLSDTPGNAAAASEFLNQEGLRVSGRSSRSINGNPASTASFSAQTENGVLEGMVAFIDYGGLTYRILGYTVQGRYNRYEDDFRGVILSFDRLRDQAVLAAEPLRIDIITLQSASSITQLMGSRGSPASATDLAIINGVGEDERIPAGTLIKWVVGRTPPGKM